MSRWLVVTSSGISHILYYLPRDLALHAPESEDLPDHLVRELEGAGDDGVGASRAARPRATAKHQAPEPQHALSRKTGVGAPRTGRADSEDEVLAREPVLILRQRRMTRLRRARPQRHPEDKDRPRLHLCRRFVRRGTSPRAKPFSERQTGLISGPWLGNAGKKLTRCYLAV